MTEVNVNKGMKQAVIWIDKDTGRIKIRSPYSASFVAFFKVKIPNEFRTWHKEEKVWSVDPKYLKELIGIASQFYEVLVEKDTSSHVDADVKALEKKMEVLCNEGYRTKPRKMEI